MPAGAKASTTPPPQTHLEDLIEDLVQPDPEQAALYGKAFQENGALLVRWAPETRARLVMEFIAAERLYPQLNDFLRKRIR